MSKDVFDGLNNMDLEDNSNFDFNLDGDYDLVSDYNTMMEEVENQAPIDMLADLANQEIDFYETVDELDFEWDDQITDDLASKGKRSYNKMKDKGNEFEKEFAGELSMYYELLEEINKFSKKLDKKFDNIDGSKAKGTSKYLNDLIASIINVKGSKLSTIKEITGLKKTIQELKMKSDKVNNSQDDGSLESSANQYFKQIMSVGRSNFVNMLDAGGDSEDYQPVDDRTFMENMPDMKNSLQDRISERLANENSGRSSDGDKYITYENQNIDVVIKYSVTDNNWEPIAVDEFNQQIIDFPVPSRKELGKVKFSADNRFMTDQFGRSYKVIEKYEGIGN